MNSIELAEYQALLKRREQLSKASAKAETDAYFNDLKSRGEATLKFQLKQREELIAKMRLGGAKYGRIVDDGNPAAAGVFSLEELMAQRQQLSRELNERQAKRDARDKDGSYYLEEYKKKYEIALKAYNDYVNGVTSKGTTPLEFRQKSEEFKVTLEAAKKEYDKYKPVTDKETEKTNRDANHIAVETAEKIAVIEKSKKAEIRANRDAALEVEQERINLMDNATAKTEAQIRLDQKRMVAAIDDRWEALLERYRDIKQKEWDIENPKAKDNGLTFNRGSVTKETMVADATVPGNEWLANAVVAINQSESVMNEITDRAYRDLRKKNEDAMNEYLAQWGQGMEKRNGIIAVANRKMEQAETEGERKSIAAQLEKDLSDFDIEANRKTSAVSNLFDDMTEKTVADMKQIYAQGQKTLTFLTSGQWNAETGLELGISEETFNTLSKSPEQLDRIRKALRQLKGDIDGTEGGLKILANGLKEVFRTGGDAKKLQQALGKISEGMQTVNQMAGFLQGTLTQLGETFGNDTLNGIAEGIGAAMDAMNAGMQGAQAGAVFGPWGAAAGAAIGLVSSLGSALSKLHDKKHERRIQKLQDQIEALGEEYGRLGKAVGKAYSKDASKMIEQQNTLLEQQRQLIQNQIAEEKAKKKTDNDRVKEWEKQIRDIDEVLAENKEKAKDAIFGEDVAAAIDRFSEAYANMFDAGTSKARASKDLVKDMIKNMIVEAMKADISEPMAKLRQMMLGFWSDEKITDWEKNRLEDYVENMLGEQEKKWGSRDRNG